MIEEAIADEELGPKFSRADTVIRWIYTDPDAQITVELREGRPGHVEYGPSELEPEVTMTMAADVGHRFWLGELNVARRADPRADQGVRAGGQDPPPRADRRPLLPALPRACSPSRVVPRRCHRRRAGATPA